MVDEIQQGFYETHLRDLPIELCYVETTSKGTFAIFSNGRQLTVSNSGIGEYVMPNNLKPANPEKYCKEALELITFVLANLGKLERSRSQKSSQLETEVSAQRQPSCTENRPLGEGIDLSKIDKPLRVRLSIRQLMGEDD